MRVALQGLLAASAILTAAPAMAAPTDLSGWTREGTGGTWNVAPNKNSVTQTINGDPTVFYSNFNALGKSLSGTIRVNGTSDDDFVGFVVGFNPGELSGGGEFLLIDWKQRTQNFHGVAPLGLAISKVTNGLKDDTGAWRHDNAKGVFELARGSTLGSVGWADLATYTFDIEYTATNVKVFVNGGLEFDVNGTFGDGRFGFYNYSQANVTYAGISDDILPPPPPGGVPEPGTWALMLMGFGLLGGALRRRTAMAGG